MENRTKKKIAFYIDKPNDQGIAFIFIRYYCKDGYLRYSTKQAVHVYEWDEKAGKFKDVEAHLDAALVLKKHFTIIDQYLAFCERSEKKDIYRKDLVTELNEKLGRKERAVKGNHFFNSLQTVIDLAEQGKLVVKSKGTKYSAGAIRNFKKTKQRLFEFDPNLDFSTIDLNTYKDFIVWCNDRNYAKNYTGSLIKEWKTLMGLAHGMGCHKNLIYNHPDFKKLEEESYQVYLDEDEIMLLYELDLSKNKKQEEIRDRYIINLYNGLRVSDMKTLELDHIQNDILTHTNQKTGKRVVMPVHTMLKKIIEKYGGKLPKQYHENIVNDEIKSIARKAGLKQTEYFTKTVGGVVRHFRKQKWEMITNHTARRSMTTNLLKHASVIEAMPVMGMSLKTLQKYNKRSAEENARMLQNNPFFRK